MVFRAASGKSIAPTPKGMAPMHQFRMAMALVLLFAWAIAPARPEVVSVYDARSLQAALLNAATGDEIVLAPGVYHGGFGRAALTGVTIRSADPQDPAVIDAAGAGEGLRLASARRVTISDVTIQHASENGINIDDHNFVTPSTDITLRNLLIQNGAGHGIKFAGVDRFHIDRVKVVDWGSGFAAINLLGAHDGVVENSLFQRIATNKGFGVKVEAGSANVAIRANRFVMAGERAIQFGGSVQPPVFRPQPAGNVAATNLVAEGNVIVDRGAVDNEMRSAVAYINVNGAVFRNNLIRRPGIFVGRILKENLLPSFIDTQNGVFNENVVVWQEGDIHASQLFNVGPGTLPATFKFQRNTWYNSTNPAGSLVGLPADEIDGNYGAKPNVSPDNVIPWKFDWGIWLVNATERQQFYDLDESAPLKLATPQAGAKLDLGSSSPLVGTWTQSPLPSKRVDLKPYSNAILISPENGTR
jgi:hypothetical protein